MSDFILTADNYYTPEANAAYMSCSQYDDFKKCEAAAMAKIEGRYVEKESDALFLGKYFHAFFEGEAEFDAYERENRGRIYITRKATKKEIELGTYDWLDADGMPRTVKDKYADIKTIDKMLKAAHNDEAIRNLIDMPGENELVMTGELFGVPFKVRFDKYIQKGYRAIVDWKTTRGIWHKEYYEPTGRRESFVHALGYLRRAAVYCEIEKQNVGSDIDPAFVLVCISKETPPDRAIIKVEDLNEQYYDFELEQMAQGLIRYQRIKKGEIKPYRCERCPYCRGSKENKEYMSFVELDSDYVRDPIEEYSTATVIVDED